MTSISNGRWLLEINKKHDVYDVALLPGNKIIITNGSTKFTCEINEVETTGKIVADFNF